MPRSRSTKRYNTSRVRQTKTLRALGPVALVWAIAKSMPRASRGEILQACADAGINKLTAAGQVQQFLHMRDLMHEEHQQQSNGGRARSGRKLARGRRQTSRSIPVFTEPEVSARRARSTSGSRRSTRSEARV